MKTKRKLKGMTLVEMIIAIAVFALLGMVLITFGVTIDNTTRATTNLKSRISTESPYAANHITYVKDTDAEGNIVTTPIPTEDTLTIQVIVPGSGQYSRKKEDPSNPGTTLNEYEWVNFDNPSVEIVADKYDTESLLPENVKDSVSNEGLNLEFLEIQSTTAGTT